MMSPRSNMFTQAVNGWAVLQAIIGLQMLFFPQLQWSLGYYPEGTPTGSDQWLLTLRVFGSYLLCVAAVLFKQHDVGLLIGGTGFVGSLIYHSGFGVNLKTVIALSTLVVGAYGIINKNSTIYKQGERILPYVFGVFGIQHVLFPTMTWMLCYPKGTPSGNNMWLFTLRCCGVLLVCLAALLMDMPIAHNLLGGAVGILGSCLVHNNFGLNPPTALGAMMVAIGAYGLFSNTSDVVVSPEARKRGMPVPRVPLSSKIE